MKHALPMAVNPQAFVKSACEKEKKNSIRRKRQNEENIFSFFGYRDGAVACGLRRREPNDEHAYAYALLEALK